MEWMLYRGKKGEGRRQFMAGDKEVGEGWRRRMWVRRESREKIDAAGNVRREWRIKGRGEAVRDKYSRFLSHTPFRSSFTHPLPSSAPSILPPVLLFSSFIFCFYILEMYTLYVYLFYSLLDVCLLCLFVFSPSLFFFSLEHCVADTTHSVLLWYL